MAGSDGLLGALDPRGNRLGLPASAKCDRLLPHRGRLPAGRPSDRSRDRSRLPPRSTWPAPPATPERQERQAVLAVFSTVRSAEGCLRVSDPLSLKIAEGPFPSRDADVWTPSPGETCLRTGMFRPFVRTGRSPRNAEDERLEPKQSQARFLLTKVLLAFPHRPSDRHATVDE